MMKYNYRNGRCLVQYECIAHITGSWQVECDDGECWRIHVMNDNVCHCCQWITNTLPIKQRKTQYQACYINSRSKLSVTFLLWTTMYLELRCENPLMAAHERLQRLEYHQLTAPPRCTLLEIHTDVYRQHVHIIHHNATLTPYL